MKEGDLTREIQLGVSGGAVRLFRNNVGTAKYLADDGTPRIVRYGLVKGSSDLVGWTTRDGVAVFTAIEVKTATGRLTKEQRAFIAAVRSAGGIAGSARSVEQALDVIGSE